jgi:hypothetical protein
MNFSRDRDFGPHLGSAVQSKEEARNPKPETNSNAGKLEMFNTPKG